MRESFLTRDLRRAIASLLIVCISISPVARAEVADLANVPLANAPSDAVLPNLMYILDDSGSMNWDYMPDQVYRTSGGTNVRNCKSCDSTGCTTAATTCEAGEPPWYAAEFNKIYYNPDITYSPGVDSTGASLGSQGSPWTAVKVDPYTSTSTKNLVSTYRVVVYCNKTNPSNADLVNSNGSNDCKRNGIDNGDFLYWGTSGVGVSYPQRGGSTSTNYRYGFYLNTNPYYFTIESIEYCSDRDLTNCIAATAPSGSYTFPAPVRWCRSTNFAAGAAPQSGSSGGSLRCKAQFDTSTYKYARYGRFVRTDIVPTTATYPKRATAQRTDCANAAYCTYAEEMTNFANWYAYYRTRMQMMKTATGRAFLPIGDRYRIGFITINPNNPVSSTKYLAIDRFDAGHKADWYTKLYQQSASGATPLREALSRVGRHYAGVTTGINSGMPQDPITHSCQQNFALLTSDGYWNGNSGVRLNDSAIGNHDNSDSGWTTRAAGAYDGNIPGASGTLADVAAYYYINDLRTTGPVSENNVPTTPKDSANHQHMTLFTLGLGLEGLMRYTPDYETDTTGDFAKIKSGSTGCSWTSGTCNWPAPAANAPSTLDDLWHAAVNGRGTYFSAADPNSLTQGLSGALAALNIQVGAAAASATSSPNVTETDNYIYSTTFRTVKWDGEIIAQQIDPTTGAVLPTIVWSAQTLLNARVSTASDTRTLYTFAPSTASNLKPFDWANLTSTASGPIAAERSWFENKCSALSQCSLLAVADQMAANSGANMVAYLRGQTQHEGTLYRDRENTLGDPVNASPVFVRAPRYNFQDTVTPDYPAFRAANANRQGVLYVAANDGMLHAFNGDTGTEMWAYIPRMLFPKLHKLASRTWDTNHEYLADGSPQVMDAYIGGAWKTILIAGLNHGGRGYYALDITDPADPKGMWEFCSDSTLCAISDPDLGFSYGYPVITKRPSDNKWIVLVTSGMNNVLPGDGKGYLYVLDLETGAVLSKTGTGEGSATTPAGLSRIAAYATNFNNDNTTRYAYGGDLLGNVWRFDLTVHPPVPMKLAELRDATGKPQSVTSRPELALLEGYPAVYVGTGRYLGADDLVDPSTLGLAWSYQQSVYAIKDTGVSLGNVRTSGTLVQQTITDTGSTVRHVSSNLVDWTVKNGWFVDFNPGDTSPGERVNLDPQLVLGTLVVVTNVPKAGACSVGGDSWIYQFAHRSGSTVGSAPLVNGQQQLAAKITGRITVGNVVVRLPNRVLKGIATDATGAKQTFGVNVGGAGGPGRRVSWREVVR